MQYCDGFLPGPRARRLPTGSGILDGLHFAVKDNIDLAGTRTGAGNPAWLAGSCVATASADIVAALLAEGAAVAGKTITDELAFSLVGNNAHYDVPINSASPDRFTGGSSSGSAAVVAAGHVDFAIGTDTAGSIRVPSSNCGLFGIRPTHGMLSTIGILGLAPSMDVPGWLARDAGMLQKVGQALLPREPSPTRPSGRESKAGVLQATLDRLGSAHAGRIRDAYRALAPDTAVDIPASRMSCNDLERAAEVLRVLQAAEAWQIFGEWAGSIPASQITPDVRARIFAGKDLTADVIEAANHDRCRLAGIVSSALADVDFLCLPTVVVPAPLVTSTAEELASYRTRLIPHTSISSLTGLPEVTVPLRAGAGVWMGLSMLGRSGADRDLLDAACRLVESRF